MQAADELLARFNPYQDVNSRSRIEPAIDGVIVVPPEFQSSMIL